MYGEWSQGQRPGRVHSGFFFVVVVPPSLPSFSFFYFLRQGLDREFIALVVLNL